MNLDEENVWAECDDKARRMVRHTVWGIGILVVSIAVALIVWILAA